MKEYRIVKYYVSFFSRWAYALEVKSNWKFLWWKGINWRRGGGNDLTSYPKSEWDKLNIVERINLEIGEEY